MPRKEIDSVIIPFRWQVSLNLLSDPKFREMVNAIFDYAKSKTEHCFTDGTALFFNEVKSRIDWDQSHYSDVCQRRSDYGKKGAAARWQKPLSDSISHKRMANDGYGNGNGNGNIKETSKENAPLFSLPSDEAIHQSSMLPKQTPFKKWTLEQFASSIDEAIEQHPEFNPYKDEFVTYWSERDDRGKMRLQREKTWETSKRLSRWYNQALARARPAASLSQQAPPTAAQIIAEIESK